MDRFFRNQKVWVLSGLALLVLGTIGAGIYYHHYFSVFAFGVWVFAEALLWKLRLTSRFIRPQFGQTQSSDYLAQWIVWYETGDQVSTMLLRDRLDDCLRDFTGPELRRKQAEALRILIEIRSWVVGQELSGKARIRSLFVYGLPHHFKADSETSFSIQIQDVIEASTYVATNYWRLFDMASGRFPELTDLSRRLFSQVFGVSFESDKARVEVERLTDSVQRGGGVAFAILNALRQGRYTVARELSQELLSDHPLVEEEIRSSLYWLVELVWFIRFTEKPLISYDQIVRYLYQLCLTSPDRTGFLEIDSQSYSQFETINSMAQEGFLFKEILIEKLLELWNEYRGYFEDQFQLIFEEMTGYRSKIHHGHEMWEMFWRREAESFGREYLYLVEANLCFVNGLYLDARALYEKALKENPNLRAALLNSVLAEAKMGDGVAYQNAVDRLSKSRELGAATILRAEGNALELLGRTADADIVFEKLHTIAGSEQKVDHWRSMFCFDHGIFERALIYAERASAKHPHDSAVKYHLSLCYDILGEKDKALKTLDNVDELPAWVRYYKFTLERESGREDEASETLLRIAPEYFDDAEELDAAIEFARHRKDLNLLRHLKKFG